MIKSKIKRTKQSEVLQAQILTETNLLSEAKPMWVLHRLFGHFVLLHLWKMKFNEKQCLKKREISSLKILHYF
jgi:hypothetical protein